MTEDERLDMLRLNLCSLAFRMQCRVDSCVERDGPEGAVTGRGVGISYLLARDLVMALEQAHAALEDAELAKPTPKA